MEVGRVRQLFQTVFSFVLTLTTQVNRLAVFHVDSDETRASSHMIHPP